MNSNSSQENGNEDGSGQKAKNTTYICEFCSAPFTKKEDFLLHFTESACKIQSIGRIQSKNEDSIEAEAQGSTSLVASSGEEQQVTVTAPQILCTVDMILCEQGDKIFIAPDTFRVAEQAGNLQQILSICQVQDATDPSKSTISDDTNVTQTQQIVIAEGTTSNVLTSTGAVVTVTGNLALEDQNADQEVKIDENQMTDEAMDIQLVIQAEKDRADEEDAERCNEEANVITTLAQIDEKNQRDGCTYQCHICEKHFKTAAGLERHKVVHTKERTQSFLCETCGKVFKTINRLMKHEESHEEAREEEHRKKHELQELEGTAEDNGETFICETCQKTFSQSCCLLEHERAHFKEKLKASKDRFSCSMCDKWFHAASHLARHEKSHDRKNSFTCETCGESFPRQLSLQKHQAMHSNVKPFLCSICGRGFMQSSNLTTHMRTHTKAKPYNCSTCGKTFSHSSSRVIHERTHTGEKPYLCETCGKKFRQSGDLAKHQRSHTGEKPYQCAVCAKTFSVQSNLLAHLRIHVKKNSQNSVAVAMLITESSAEGGASVVQGGSGEMAAITQDVAEGVAEGVRTAGDGVEIMEDTATESMDMTENTTIENDGIKDETTTSASEAAATTSVSGLPNEIQTGSIV